MEMIIVPISEGVGYVRRLEQCPACEKLSLLAIIVCFLFTCLLLSCHCLPPSSNAERDLVFLFLLELVSLVSRILSLAHGRSLVNT